ncbi:MAG TPA: universal stress protein [Octadecabacter sp.]|nr:universal stress protein [Octadecabacter sp.]
MFEKIVVGFDGSEPSERALTLACDLAGKYGSQIHLVYTPQPPTVAYAMGAIPGYQTAALMPPMDEVREANEKVVAQGMSIAERSGQTLSETHIKTGEPGDVLVDYAEKTGADLIVLGRRGLGALGAIVQGSTSVRVNHIAKCATLSVV